MQLNVFVCAAEDRVSDGRATPGVDAGYVNCVVPSLLSHKKIAQICQYGPHIIWALYTSSKII